MARSFSRGRRTPRICSPSRCWRSQRWRRRTAKRASWKRRIYSTTYILISLREGFIRLSQRNISIWWWNTWKVETLPICWRNLGTLSRRWPDITSLSSSWRLNSCTWVESFTGTSSQTTSSSTSTGTSNSPTLAWAKMPSNITKSFQALIDLKQMWSWNPTHRHVQQSYTGKAHSFPVLSPISNQVEKEIRRELHLSEESDRRRYAVSVLRTT